MLTSRFFSRRNRALTQAISRVQPIERLENRLLFRGEVSLFNNGALFNSRETATWYHGPSATQASGETAQLSLQSLPQQAAGYPVTVSADVSSNFPGSVTLTQRNGGMSSTVATGSSPVTITGQASIDANHQLYINWQGVVPTTYPNVGTWSLSNVKVIGYEDFSPQITAANYPSGTPTVTTSGFPSPSNVARLSLPPDINGRVNVQLSGTFDGTVARGEEYYHVDAVNGTVNSGGADGNFKSNPTLQLKSAAGKSGSYTIHTGWDDNANNHLDVSEYERTILVNAPVVETLTVKDHAHTSNTVTASDATAKDLYIAENASGYGIVDIMGTVSPSNDDSKQLAVWKITPSGGSASPDHQNLLSATTATLAPDAGRDFRIDLGFDANNNGQFDANEAIERTVNVHVIKLDSLTITDRLDPTNSLTVSHSPSGNDVLYVGQVDENAEAHVDLSGVMRPGTNGAKHHVLWDVDDSTGAPIDSGDFNDSSDVDITPVGDADHIFTARAGVDADDDGFLDDSEVTRSIDIDVIALKTLTAADHNDSTNKAVSDHSTRDTDDDAVPTLYIGQDDNDNGTVIADLSAEIFPVDQADKQRVLWEVKRHDGSLLAANDGAHLGQINVTPSGDDDRTFTLTAGVDVNNDTILSGDEISRRVRIQVVRMNLVAHRTGGNLGDEVSQAIEDAGDPTKYLILTNDDHEQGLPDDGKDYDADTVTLPVGGPTGSDSQDDDFAKITLKKLPSTLDAGSVQIVLSDPSAVRLFKDDGTPLSDDELTQVFTSGEDEGDGYLAGLKDHDVDVWIEGVTKDSDLTLTVKYKNPAGKVISSDNVHLLVAKWGWQEAAASGAQDITWAASVSRDVLLAAADGSADQSEVPDSAKFKATLDGLPSDADVDFEMRSTGGDDDAYNGTLQYESGLFQSAPLGMYHSDDGEVLSTSEKAEIQSALGLNVMHNDGIAATTKTTNDEQSRKLKGIIVEIDPAGRIFDNATGKYTQRTMSDLGSQGTHPINAVINPAAFIIQSAEQATDATASIVRISRIKGLTEPFDPNDDRFLWTWVSKGGGQGQVAFVAPNGKTADKGEFVYLRGVHEGRVELQLSVKDGANYRQIETYDAVVVQERTIPFRVQLLTDGNGAGTKVSADQAANQILRQIGVRLVADDQHNGPPEDGAIAVDGKVGYFTKSNTPTAWVKAIPMGYSDSPVTGHPDDDIEINEVSKVLQIVYVESDARDSLGGHTVNAPGSTQNSITSNLRMAAGELSNQQTLKINNHVAGGNGLDNWGLLMTNIWGDPSANAVFYADTLAHEVGHILGFLHRAPGDDGLPDDPAGSNVMADARDQGEQFRNRVDFDLVQAMAVQYAKVFN